MLTYDPAVNVPANLDLRRDATILLIEDISVHILDLAMEDAPTEDDIRLLTDFFDEEEWTGIFQTDTNAERIYEVKYKYDSAHFFITTYTMTFCKKIVPPHLYEES